MPGRVSCQLYLLLDALENFDISLDLRSREISNFPTHLEVNTTNRKHTLSLYSIFTSYTNFELFQFRSKQKYDVKKIWTNGVKLFD